MTAPPPRLVIEADPNATEVDFLEERIYEHIVQQTGITDGAYLAVFLRGEDDRLVGGAYGWTFGGACYVRFLFVPADLRGRGHGMRVMRAVEQEAVRRGCTQIVLETYDFQAPDFYRKLGFSAVSTVPDFPRGHQRMTMRKPLASRRVQQRQT